MRRAADGRLGRGPQTASTNSLSATGICLLYGATRAAAGNDGTSRPSMAGHAMRGWHGSWPYHRGSRMGIRLVSSGQLSCPCVPGPQGINGRHRLAACGGRLVAGRLGIKAAFQSEQIDRGANHAVSFVWIVCNSFGMAAERLASTLRGALGHSRDQERSLPSYPRFVNARVTLPLPAAGGIGMFRPEGPAFFIARTALIFSAIVLAIVSFLLRH